MADIPTEIVQVDPVFQMPPGVEDIVVLARTPEEMAVSQDRLIRWAQQKVAAEKAELAEKEENLAYAKKGKYQTTRWQRQVNLAKSRVVYYEKMLAVVEAGYYMVPAFPEIDTIAIRTRKRVPAGKQRESTWGVPRVPLVKSQTLPAGEGRYVSPEPEVDRWTENRDNGKGGETTHHLLAPKAFAEVDFPFHAVKPQILRDFNRALRERLFDEIGVLPQRRRRGDPMVIGSIKRREGYSEITANFLVSWWIDTRDL
jgi:hypothetical protein